MKHPYIPPQLQLDHKW